MQGYARSLDKVTSLVQNMLSPLCAGIMRLIDFETIYEQAGDLYMLGSWR